jgi:hypothetical protein
VRRVRAVVQTCECVGSWPEDGAVVLRRMLTADGRKFLGAMFANVRDVLVSEIEGSALVVRVENSVSNEDVSESRGRRGRAVMK